MRYNRAFDYARRGFMHRDGIVREKILVNEMSRSVNSRQSSLSQHFSKNHRAVDKSEVSHFAVYLAPRLVQP